MIIRFEKETILPNQNIEDPRAFCWFKAGIYQLEKCIYNNTLLYLMPDTSFGAGLGYFIDLDGIGGISIISIDHHD